MKLLMAMETEYGTKLRLLHIMQAVLERPYGYTMRELAEQYGVSKDTIKHDFEAFANAGLILKYDKLYRYAFVEENPYQQLKDLLHFSEEEQFLLEEAINQLSDHSAISKRLKRRLKHQHHPIIARTSLYNQLLRVGLENPARRGNVCRRG